MLGINCLLKNQQILPKLKQLVEYVGYNIASNGRRPTIETVFNTMRKANIEVDIQTVSHLYEDVFDLTDNTFSTQQEVEDARGATFNRIKEKKQQVVKKNEIGRDNPAVTVASQIADMISTDLKANPTIQKLMQERLLKIAKRKLELKGKKTKDKSFVEIITEVLTLENNNPYGVFGNLENAETLFNEFKKEFTQLSSIAGTPYQQAQIQMYAKELAGAAYSFMMSTQESTKVINDTLKEAGFTKEISTKNGKKTVTDWKRVLAEGVDFRKTFSDVFTKNGFKPNEVKRIVTELESDFNKLQQEKAKSALEAANKRAQPKNKEFKSAMDKLVGLYQLGIFNNTSQEALFKVLGISGAGAKELKTLQGLMKQYNQSLKQPMSKWSPTYIKTLQREIENIIERIEEKDVRLKAIRIFGFINQLNGAAILNNLQNITENTTSGFVEWAITLFRNPKQAFESAKIFGSVFKDVLGGGVREGHELSNAFNTSGNLEDRYNYETAQTQRGKVSAFFGLLPRLVLSTFDNAYKASITHLLTVGTLRKILKQQGLNNDEAAVVINEMYYGNRNEVEKIAKELADNLSAAGVRNIGDKWKRIAAEISVANMLSDGKFFQDTLDKLRQGDNIASSKNIKLNDKLIRSIRKAAEATASKGLGHEADTLALKLMDKINAGLQENITEARKNKDRNALVRAELGRNAYGMVNRFRSGALRWMWLSFQKASGISLIQTLITDVAANKGKYLNIDNLRLNSENEQEITEDLSRYLALRQRLVRETAIPLMSYTVGYLVILPMMLKAFGFDEDDEKKKGEAYGKLAKWIQEDPARKRWFQKGLPTAVYNYLDKQTKESFGNISIVKNPSAPSFADVIDTDIAANAILNNLNQSTLYKLADDYKKEMNKAEPQTGAVLGKFLGNFLNLGGVLKNYQINKDAIKALGGDATKLSKDDFNKLKPESLFEGFLYNTLDRENYKRVVGEKESDDGLTPEEKEDPTIKTFMGKGVSFPDYDPKKVATKYINGKPTEHLYEHDPKVQEDYVTEHKANYKAELVKLKNDTYKVYRATNGAVHIKSKTSNESGMTYIPFKDLTDKEIQYLEGLLTRRATVKTKKNLKFELDDIEKSDNQ